MLSCSRLGQRVPLWRACVRGEVFPSGGTAWGDDSALASVCPCPRRSLGKVREFCSLVGVCDEYGEYRVGPTQAYSHAQAESLASPALQRS